MIKINFRDRSEKNISLFGPNDLATVFKSCWIVTSYKMDSFRVPIMYFSLERTFLTLAIAAQVAALSRSPHPQPISLLPHSQATQCLPHARLTGAADS